MGQKAEIRLDILIKRVDDYYQAHCLQFDIVATSDSLGEVRKDIIDLCRAHIEYAYEYDNLEHLFSPAPKEVWADYLALPDLKERCIGCDEQEKDVVAGKAQKPVKKKPLKGYVNDSIRELIERLDRLIELLELRESIYTARDEMRGCVCGEEGKTSTASPSRSVHDRLMYGE